MKYLLLFFFAQLFIYTNIFTQNDLKFDRYTTEEGLDQDYIRAICQDKYGFIWIGTKAGANRFDGIDFKNYVHDKQDTTSIGRGWISGIVIDNKNRLWFGIAGPESFLVLYENERFLDVGKEIPIPIREQSSLSNLYADSKGYLWFGTNEKKFFAFNYDTKELLDFNNDELFKKNEAGIMSAFHEDNQGNIWMGNSNAGLFKYNWKSKTFTNWKHNPNDPNSLSSNNVLSILQDHNGDIWIGTFNGGLNKFTANGFKHFTHDPSNANSLPSNTVYALLEDGYNNLWLGTVNGLALMDRENGTFHSYQYDEDDNESINSNTARTLFFDNTQNLWVGTRLGLAKLKNQKFKTYSYSSDENSISNNKVVHIIEEENKNILLATIKTIDVFDRQKNDFDILLEVGNPAKSLVGPPLYMLESNNTLWVGTWAAGLQHYNLKNNSSAIYQPKLGDTNTLNNDRIFTVFDFNDKQLWVGTYGGGINILNKKEGTFTVIKHNPDDSTSVSSNFIEKIIKDKKNNIWISTPEGLNLLTDPEELSFRHFFHDIQITDFLDSEGDHLWVGTHEGLYKFNTQTFEKSFYDSEGISSILQQDKNSIWVAAKNELIHLSTDFKTAKHYKKNDGLQREYVIRSSCKLSDGTMVFGGTMGFSMFHPDSIKDNEIPPQVVISELLVHSKPIQPGDTLNDQVILSKTITDTKAITLNYKNNAFTLKFAALHYNIPRSNQYKYKLEGYDPDWRITDALKREAIYMNLPNDEYTFYVKGSNSDGIWNDSPAKLSITILPPWWSTWWFRSLIVIVVIASSISAYSYRIRLLKERQRYLEQKVAERTAELREANSQLEEIQEEIMQQNEEIITVNNQLKTKNEEIESQKEEIQASRDQLEKAFNNITLLSEFGQKLTATFDFDDINKMIYEYVSSLMDTAAFGIGIYNDKRKIIDFPYFMENGEPVPYFYKDLESKKSLSVRCFKNSEEIYISDLSVDYKKLLGELPDVQTSKLPSSVIHLPLTIENKPIGTLTVNSFKKNAYNENDIANLRTLASYISIALDNSKAYRIIRSKNEQISGSIRYGQTIQQAMLPPKQQLDNYFENFVIFRPKDIVSGDFYWFVTVETRHALSLPGKPMYFLAIVDCTGHGVPGAFMSMIGSRLLNDIVIERKVYSPAKILEQLNIMIRRALRQDTTDNQDGMDLCLCRFQHSGNEWELTYAGAKRPLIFYNSKSNQIEEIRGTRRSIGGVTARSKTIAFTEESLNINAKDMFYLSTDGLVDQCNPKKQKFSHKKLVDLLRNICHLPLEEQKDITEKELDTFQAGFEQRDDITLVGIKIKE